MSARANQQQNMPVVGIPADRKMVGKLPFHAVGEKYITAVHDAAECLPLVIPALGAEVAAPHWLQTVDGILLTGSLSNVEPKHYAGERHAGMLYDAARDATTLPLIEQVLEAGVPLLAICRGFQEMNVALGGTLDQTVHLTPGRLDHREREALAEEMRYAPVHALTLTRGGVLHPLAGADEVQVNSLHTQGVAKLASGVAVEAVAPDGLVEAFTVRGAKNFTLAVQWHPEWRALENAFSHAIFSAFGQACRRRREQRAETR